MSWNNGLETKKFREYLKRMINEYRRQGMTTEQICIMVEYEQQQFKFRRRKLRYGEEIPLYILDEDNNERIVVDVEQAISDEVYTDPFQYGFDDTRLSFLWNHSDNIDQIIMRLLGEGKKQREIARLLKLSEKAISKRIDKMRKKFF